MVSAPLKPKWRRKAEERPEALYQAALSVFGRRGYRATRLEEVAEAAGVSKGTIYHYFRNKEDLLERALEYKMTTMLALAEAAVEEFEGTAADRLRFLLRRSWDRWSHKDWGRFNKLLLGEIAHELPALFRLWVRNGLMRSWRLAERVITEGQRRGEFRPDADARCIARLLHSGLSQQALLQIHLGVGKWDHPAAAGMLAAASDFAIQGLAVRPVRGKKA